MTSKSPTPTAPDLLARLMSARYRLMQNRNQARAAATAATTYEARHRALGRLAAYNTALGLINNAL